MSLKLFIAGTDTNVGKTHVSVNLLNTCRKFGKTTLGIKPVASGCKIINGKPYNADALALQKASTLPLDYETINPFAFEPAVAPHLAAQKINCDLTVNSLNQKMAFALSQPVDICLIEGAGGWLTPLNDHETMADFVKSQNLDTILVVGIRLGCINHAQLTLRAMQADNINVVGWVANCIEPNMLYRNENIETLKRKLTIPCLDIIEHNQSSFSMLRF